MSPRADLDDWGRKTLLPLAGIELQLFGYHPYFYSSVTVRPVSHILFSFILSIAPHFLAASFLYVTRSPRL